MTGRDVLAVASQLAAGSTEAEWSSAISRAYYAAFHVAPNCWRICGLPCLMPIGRMYISPDDWQISDFKEHNRAARVSTPFAVFAIRLITTCICP